MNLLRQLWQDEAGYILSAEAALLGTVGIVGAGVGLGAASKSINDELTESAYAFRSLNQSYRIDGQMGSGAWTAGSGFTQRDVEQSHAELDRWIAEQRAAQNEAVGDDDRTPVTTSTIEEQRRRRFEQRRGRYREQMRQRQQEQDESIKGESVDREAAPRKESTKQRRQQKQDS